MKDLFNNKKLAIRIILYLFLCILVVWTAYTLYGRKIIQYAYEGKPFWFLNRMITSSKERPLAGYYNEADRRFIMGISYIVVSTLIVAAILLLKKRVRKILIVNLVITFVLFEAVIALMLFSPSLAKFGSNSFMQSFYYNSEYFRIIQVEPGCARYDSELTYTLRPGIFYFSGKKFNNEFRVNSLGLRDDEDSLAAPEVIVLGDSVAMGWGVNQEETFAQLIEHKSGLKVLNAAISSYGTVREMRLLNRIDTSKLKILVIQYDDNDYEENKKFYNKNNTLRISSRKAYERTVKDYLRKRRYYPGKYVMWGLRNIVNYLLGDRSCYAKGVDVKAQATFFLNALKNSGKKNLINVKIIVVELKGNSGFVSDLKRQITSGTNPACFKNISIVNLPNEFLNSPLFCYPLDGHATDYEHKIIADEILKVINEKLKEEPFFTAEK